MIRKNLRKFGTAHTSIPHLVDKHLGIIGSWAVVTGATDGIGKQTALNIAEYKHHIIIVGRDKNKCKNVCGEISRKTNNDNVEYSRLLLALLAIKVEVLRESGRSSGGRCGSRSHGPRQNKRVIFFSTRVL